VRRQGRETLQLLSPELAFIYTFLAGKAGKSSERPADIHQDIFTALVVHFSQVSGQLLFNLFYKSQSSRNATIHKVLQYSVEK